MNTNPGESRRRRRKIVHPDGIAIEPREVLQESDDAESSSCSLEKGPQQQQQQSAGDTSATADLFVTMVSH
jgi:hypothetical protein